MKDRRWTGAAVAALLLAALGGSGCVNSLTEGSDAGFLEVVGTITNADGEPTLTRLTMVIDGNAGDARVVPESLAREYHFYGTNGKYGGGAHRLEMRIRQSVARSRYRFTGFVVSHCVTTGLFSWKSVARVTLPDATLELDDGAAAVWDFQL